MRTREFDVALDRFNADFKQPVAGRSLHEVDGSNW